MRGAGGGSVEGRVGVIAAVAGGPVLLRWGFQEEGGAGAGAFDAARAGEAFDDAIAGQHVGPVSPGGFDFVVEQDAGEAER